MSIPFWAKLAIMAAWAVLKNVLSGAGIPAVVITAIEDVLRSLGLLGAAQLTHEEVHAKAAALSAHCSGVACPPDLVSM